MTSTSKQASSFIVAQQQRVRGTLPFSDTDDFEDAQRGFIAARTPNAIHDATRAVVWDNDTYDFLNGDAPDTVNPSLWRQSQLDAIQGLFEVVEGIYQVRGFDLSNITFIEGETGVLVLDPLVTEETAAAAPRAVPRAPRGPSSHGRAVHPPARGPLRRCQGRDVAGGRRRRTGADHRPRGVHRARRVRERLRRAPRWPGARRYMFGAALARGPQRRGRYRPRADESRRATSRSSHRPWTSPTPGQEETVDGVRMVFQMAPETEAPAEFLVYFPDHKALCAAEDATHTLHNLLTLRGALVRDPHAWAHYLTETIDLFGNDVEVVFASHHWPTWGNERVVTFLSRAARPVRVPARPDAAADQQGTGPGSRSPRSSQLPPALENAWHARGYYGSVSHDIKAIYQRYMGWYDGNPAHLWQHPPVEQGKRYVELGGGADAVVDQGPVRRSRRATTDGSRRSSATSSSPSLTTPRRANCSPTPSSSSATGRRTAMWRNIYLSGATELRDGQFGTPTASRRPRTCSRALTPEMLFDAIAIQVDGPRAWNEKLSASTSS